MTKQNPIQEMVENIKNGVLRKFPLLGATMSALKFEPTTDMDTAATDGQKVVFNPQFMEELPYDQKVFVFAHEIMHVAFDHLQPSKGRDNYCWNLATDSVINQMLFNANLPAPEGVVDVALANGKSAEEMYQVFEKKQKQSEKQNRMQGGQTTQDSQGGQPNQDGQPNQNPSQNDLGQNDFSFDDLQKKYSPESMQKNHKIWDEGTKSAEQSNQNSGAKQKKLSDNVEKNFEQKNTEFKKELAKHIRENLSQEKYEAMQSGIGNGVETFAKLGEVGDAKQAVSWKKILKKELEKTEDRWTYRRASQENDFQASIGALDIQDRAETEVMLDVSGSISEDFLKGFLRQLKPLLRHSNIKVGFFADRATANFQQIKKFKDIDDLMIRRPGSGTNMDAAVKAFSKSKHINKIVFTDGEAGVMPSKETKNTNVIWLVYKNKNFNPCCGKVVFVDWKDLKNIKQQAKENQYFC